MPYRNDEDAVEARRVELERELADLKDRVTQFAYLSWKQKELEAELADLRKQKADYARTRLPMLSQAKIASPCTASWEQMKGDEQVRFCGGCQKNVYDLSAMTSTEAEALLQEKEGKLCARFYRRNDGTIMTSDCSVGVRRKWATRAAAAAAVFGSAALAFKTFGPKAECSRTMGDVSSIDPATATPVAMGSIAPPSDPAPQTVTPPNDPPQKQTPHMTQGMGVTTVPHHTMGMMLKSK